MSKFWVLGEPGGVDAEARRAKWNNKDELRYEQILCPVDPEGHRRAGMRISRLSVALPNLEPYDFVWTCWECLVQEPVLRHFNKSGFKGYEAAPSTVRFAGSSRRGPEFWELRAIGSAGCASPASGYEITKVCPGCGLVNDSKIDDPTKVVDESRWDGSDFFRVEPVSGWLFVTDRVVQALRDSQFKGWKAYSLVEMKEALDIAVPGHAG